MKMGVLHRSLSHLKLFIDAVTVETQCFASFAFQRFFVFVRDEGLIIFRQMCGED